MTKNYYTTKLFYNKYIYKIRIKNNISTIFRGLNLRYAKSRLDEMQQSAESDLPIPSPFWRGLREPRYVSLETFMDACVIHNVLEKNKSRCMVRCEGVTLDIYSNEKDWLEDLSKLLYVEEFHQPEKDTEDFLKNNVDVVISPEEVIWPYKVYLGRFVDPNFAVYCDNNPHIKIGKKALECIRKQQYVQGFYFWIKTENQLMLAKIALGGGIGKVVKFVSKADLHK